MSTVISLCDITGHMAQPWVEAGYHAATVRGERDGNSKVTERHVREIRARYRAGETQRLLAEEFGISSSQVSNICRSASWSHVKEEVA